MKAFRRGCVPGELETPAARLPGPARRDWMCAKSLSVGPAKGGVARPAVSFLNFVGRFVELLNVIDIQAEHAAAAALSLRAFLCAALGARVAASRLRMPAGIVATSPLPA